MKPLRYLAPLVVLLAATVSAFAGIPVLPELPDGIAARYHDLLIPQWQDLASQRQALLDEGRALNADCKDIDSGSDKHQDCLKRADAFNRQSETLQPKMEALGDEICVAGVLSGLCSTKTPAASTLCSKPPSAFTGPGKGCAKLKAGIASGAFNSRDAAANYCAAKLKVGADERAIQQMNFGNETRSFEMFADVSAEQKAKFQKKVLDALLDQGLEVTKMAADSAKSLNPYNVNATIKRLRAEGLNNDAIFAGLRKIAATKDKPAMAAAYKSFVDLVKNEKEGYDAGKDMAEDSQDANLRLLLGVLKVAQGDSEVGLVVTGADFGVSFAYLGYISGQVDDLTQVTDSKLLQLNSLIDRLKQDVSALNAAKQDWAGANDHPGEPDCRT
jgi:hypothetical protein